MAQRDFLDQVTPLIRLSTVLLMIAVLYLGREIFVPIAVAGLLSFMLAPVANFLERWYLPRIPSVMIIVTAAFIVLGGVSLLVADQTLSLAKSLPDYQYNIKQRLQAFESGADGMLGNVRKMFVGLQKQVEQEKRKKKEQAGSPSPADQSTAASEPTQPPPVPVVIQSGPSSPLELAREIALPVLAPALTAGLTLVFVIFFLFQREDLRDRMIRLLGDTRLDVTTRALDEAGKRISRYLLVQLSINITYGLPIGIVLWLIGVPGAALWGILATALRFIPYIGVWLAAAMPILLALAVFHGWTLPLAVVALFVGLELFVANVMEPWLYGASTGISAVGVLVAAVFWGALWGGIGLIMAIPLTVCLVVAGRHIPQFGIFVILFGREPALSPAIRFYQRLLADDQDEVMELALTHAQDHGLLEVYDEMVVPALHLAERDRHAERLEPERAQAILDGVRAVVDELGDQPTITVAGNGATPADEGTCSILCLPARDEADELAATMFAQVLQTRGISAEVLSVRSLAAEFAEKVCANEGVVVYVSALPPAAVAHARYLCKRIKRQSDSTIIVVGLWNVTGNLERMTERLQQAGADHVVTTYGHAADQIRGILNSSPQIAV